MEEGLNRRQFLKNAALAGAAVVMGGEAEANEKKPDMPPYPMEQMSPEIKILETLNGQYAEAQKRGDAVEEKRLGIEIGKQIEKMNGILEEWGKKTFR